MRKAFCILLCGLAGTVTAAQGEAKKPNIVLLVADDLGYADVSFNGGDIPTPALDRLAKEGVRLGNFYACPVCTPTRAGLMTGRYPLRFGCMRAVIPPWRKRGMPPEEQTLAELCAKAGYERRAIIGKWHLGHSSRSFHPQQQGFTHFYGHYNGAIDYFTHEREDEVDWHRNAETVKEEGYSTDLLGREAVRFIEESAKSPGPFLLYLPFNAPHSPFQAVEADLKRFPKMKGVRQKYAAMVHAMDRAVKGILDALDRLKLTDNTFVLFFSDNGGVRNTADNRPWRGGKITVYEGGIRVCAAARWPAGGIAGGKDINRGPIGYIDVYPTIKNMIGLKDEPDPNPLDGVDVLAVLRGQTDAPRRAWFSYLHQGGPVEHWSVIEGSRKLVVHCKNILALELNVELYDLDKDPGEKKDIAKAHPKVCKALLAKLRDFRKTQNNPMPQYGVGRDGFKAPKDWKIAE